jgi:hypothetical protein
MIGVPQLSGNENVFACDPCGSKSHLQRLAHLALVAVSFRTIEMSKSGFQCVSGRSFRHGRVGNQGTEAECGHMAAAVVERHSHQPKIGRFRHGAPPRYFAFSITLGFKVEVPGFKDDTEGHATGLEACPTGQRSRNPKNTGDKIAGAIEDKNVGSKADAAD